MSSNVYSKKSNNVSNLLRFVDSFYMKFLVVLISLIVPAGITMTKVFGVEKFSKMGVFIFIIAATFLTFSMEHMDDLDNLQFQQFTEWAMDESLKAVTPFDHGGYVQGPGFNPSDTMHHDMNNFNHDMDHGMHDSMNSGMDNHFNGF